MASLSGTSGNDLLNGTIDNDTINGLAGDDTIHGLEGNDSLNGGSGNDLLYGDDGNDILNGGIGTDTMRGGTGDDTYYVDNVGDLTIEGSSAGIDLVKASVTWKLASNFENLTLTGTAAINATGNSLANILVGNSANNTLNGLGGADRMKGAAGDDIYIVDNVGDVVVEGVSAGTDLVKSSVSWRLGNNVENLTLTGAAATNGTGNGLDNVITGNSAANILSGLAGADKMSGGAGDDIYIVDNSGDQAIETRATDGTDIVKSSVSFTLGAYLENLTLTGTAAIDGTGNFLDNVITGNGSANILDGGLGADRMAGGAGDDTYVVDNVGDRAIESVSKGTDIVESSISYTLGANLENLTLIGDAAINGTGNALANSISGNAAANSIGGGDGDDFLSGLDGNDTLNGDGGNDLLEGGTGSDTIYGGAGNDILNPGPDTTADTLVGGTGDDSYYATAGDSVVELDGEGTDQVIVSILPLIFFTSYTLPDFVENGTLSTYFSGSYASATLNGNALNNILIGDAGTDHLNGNGGADALYGGGGSDLLDGGAGDDTMEGGTGDDIYYLDSISDVVLENGGEGTDAVVASVSGYALPANIENGSYELAVDGSMSGNDADNALGFGHPVNGTLYGLGGNDTLMGSSGTNTLYGGTGNDLLYGYGAADTLYGEDGNDFVVGGSGVDVLWGGSGADTFLYDDQSDSTIGTFDTIMDFVSGSDKIDVSAIDANTSVAGDQAFSWTLFHTGAGQWWSVPDGTIPNLYHIYFDYDGGVADMRIDYYGGPLSISDIIG